MDRRTALGVLLAAAPALSQTDKIKWADSAALANEPVLLIRPDHRIVVNLDQIISIRVTKGDLGVDISAQELFDALVR